MHLVVSAHFTVFTPPAADRPCLLCRHLLHCAYLQLISVTHVTGPWPGPEDGVCKGMVCVQRHLSAMKTGGLFLLSFACVSPAGTLHKGTVLSPLSHTAAGLWSQLFSSLACCDFRLLDVFAGQGQLLLLTAPGWTLLCGCHPVWWCYHQKKSRQYIALHSLPVVRKHFPHGFGGFECVVICNHFSMEF